MNMQKHAPVAIHHLDMYVSCHIYTLHHVIYALYIPFTTFTISKGLGEKMFCVVIFIFLVNLITSKLSFCVESEMSKSSILDRRCFEHT